MYLKLRIDDALPGIFSHSGAAKIMTAAHSGKPIAAPGSGGTHTLENLFRLCFHPIRQPMFILSEIASDSKNRKTNSAPVAKMRVEVDEIVKVRQCVGLDANDAEMLPLEEVILVGFTPALDAWRQRFATDLDRQELLLGAQRSTTDEASLEGVEIGSEKVIQHQTLGGWTGVPIKDRFREKAINVGKHFRHEMLPELAPIISQPIRMLRIAREKKQPEILKRVRA